MQLAALVSQEPHVRRKSTSRKVRGGSWCRRQRAREDAAAQIRPRPRRRRRRKPGRAGVDAQDPGAAATVEPRRGGYGTPTALSNSLQPGPASLPTAADTGVVRGKRYRRDDGHQYGFPAASISLLPLVYLAAVLSHPSRRLHPTFLTPLLPVHYLHL